MGRWNARKRAGSDASGEVAGALGPSVTLVELSLDPIDLQIDWAQIHPVTIHWEVWDGEVDVGELLAEGNDSYGVGNHSESTAATPVPGHAYYGRVTAFGEDPVVSAMFEV